MVSMVRASSTRRGVHRRRRSVRACRPSGPPIALLSSLTKGSAREGRTRSSGAVTPAIVVWHVAQTPKTGGEKTAATDRPLGSLAATKETPTDRAPTDRAPTDRAPTGGAP